MAILLSIRPQGTGDPFELTFDQERVRIGRGAMCDLQLPHTCVSSIHAMILLEKARYFLVDLGSTNGTTLAGEVLVVERRKLLRSGDVIGIAGFEIEFRAGVAMVSYHSQDRTASVARHLANQVMITDGFEMRNTSLVVVSGPQTGQRFELKTTSIPMTVGRADDNDIILNDREASRHHLALVVSVEGVALRDLGGKNPVLINDRPLSRQRLRDRDELLVGATRLVFDDPVEAYLRELAQCPDVQLAPTRAIVPDEEPPVHASSKPTELLAEEASNRQTDEVLSVKEVSEDQASSPEQKASDGGQGPSRKEAAGVEIVILFVGSIVLAICIAALVWIFS